MCGHRPQRDNVEFEPFSIVGANIMVPSMATVP